MPLVAHFLNVGRGDCTIIEFPSGRVGVIDIDNLRLLDPETEREVLEEYHESLGIRLLFLEQAQKFQIDRKFLEDMAKKLTDPLAYYNTHIGQTRDIFRFIITHPDMDHMTGLCRMSQDANKSIVNFWHTGLHDFNLGDTTPEEWATCPYDKADWDTYKRLRASTSSSPTSLQRYRGQTGDFWTEDGVEIWAPTPELEKLAVGKEQSNIISMVLKISYKGWSFIMGGDATADETWPAIYPDTNMQGRIVLKASHHGRKTGYHQPSIKEMAPWLTITSVGEKEHDATEHYRRYSDHTVSLRKSGDIALTIDDNGKLWYPPNVAECWKVKS
jgi:competence protein ComEC